MPYLELVDAYELAMTCQNNLLLFSKHCNEFWLPMNSNERVDRAIRQLYANCKLNTHCIAIMQQRIYYFDDAKLFLSIISTGYRNMKVLEYYEQLAFEYIDYEAECESCCYTTRLSCELCGTMLDNNVNCIKCKLYDKFNEQIIVAAIDSDCVELLQKKNYSIVVLYQYFITHGLMNRCCKYLLHMTVTHHLVVKLNQMTLYDYSRYIGKPLWNTFDVMTMRTYMHANILDRNEVLQYLIDIPCLHESSRCIRFVLE